MKKTYFRWRSASGKTGLSTEAGILKLLRGGTTFTMLKRPKAASARARILRIARAELGVTEHPPGSNRGERVEQYQAATTVPGTGWAYCMAWIVWLCREASIPLAYRGAYVPHFEQWAKAAGRWSATLPPAWHDAVVAVVFDFGRDGLADHVGLLEHAKPIVTLEANTLPGAGANQAEGGGVYRRPDRTAAQIRGYVLITR